MLKGESFTLSWILFCTIRRTLISWEKKKSISDISWLNHAVRCQTIWTVYQLNIVKFKSRGKCKKTVNKIKVLSVMQILKKMYLKRQQHSPENFIVWIVEYEIYVTILFFFFMLLTWREYYNIFQILNCWQD